jgi:hypothetical protein
VLQVLVPGLRAIERNKRCFFEAGQVLIVRELVLLELQVLVPGCTYSILIKVVQMDKRFK